MNIYERTLFGQTVYDVLEQGPDGRSRVTRTIYVPFVKVKLPDRRIVYIIYDEEMCPISPIYRFLNEKGQAGKSPNTLERKVSSLRYLVAFCELHLLRDFHIPEHLCADFIDFIYGEPRRMSSSVRGNFLDIVTFFKFLRYDSEPFMEYDGKTVIQMGADGLSRPVKFRSYRYSPAVNHDKNKLCPLHVSVREFYKLLKVIKDAGDFTVCIIVTLEFYTGRRVGELLGLTVEDLSSCVDTETGEVSPCIYLRNRVGDGRRRSAKKRLIPKSVADYSSASYTQEYASPFGCFVLENAMSVLLHKYYDRVHGDAQLNSPAYYAQAEADIVDPMRFHSEWGLDRNHYFFLDSRGSSLSYGALYRRLMKYYALAGVPVGHGKSVNHGFRHGLGYLMRQEMGVSSEKIAAMLGHKGTGSVDVYANADVMTIARLNDEVSKFISGQLDSLPSTL